MIGHNQRFVASHQKARELIEKGKSVKFIVSVRLLATVVLKAGAWTEKKAGSSKRRSVYWCYGDLGVHKTDMLRYILNEEIVEVGAFVESNAKDFANVDDNAVCVLKRKAGLSGRLRQAGLTMEKKITPRLFTARKGFFV